MPNTQLLQKNIRNIAIIAHVDHGKTTLVDAFMKQSNLFRANQDEMNQVMILDSGDLEREKGITITAKNIAVRYGDYKINIIDTPGHADFGGEVERTLNMANGCVLLVDAQEGPMPQTKFVLKKAMEMGLQPIVILNKIDKKFANIPRTIERIHDLFLSLATNSDQLEFPTLYAIGREGKVFYEIPDVDLSVPNAAPGDLKPLLETIIKHIPAPVGNEEEPFQMQITSLEFDPHIGRYLIGKIERGTLKNDDGVIVVKNKVIDEDAPVTDEANDPTKPNYDVVARGRVKKILVREGLGFTEVQSASAGEIIAIAGIETSRIGATVCIASNPEPLREIKLSPPALKIKFEANTSPLVGKDGKLVTPKVLQQRLERESETNISLQITKADDGNYYIAGRGELQLAILIETLRRENYEFQVKRPEVVMHTENGVLMEPVEELIIDTPQEYSNAVASVLSTKKSDLVNMELEGEHVRYTYNLLTRNLIGLRNLLLTATKGNVIMNNFLSGYTPYTKQPEPFRKGVLVASESGEAAAYALDGIQYRGELFIEAATQVYEGMIIGINKYENDMDVNVSKARHKSGVRVNQSAITHIMLKPITPLSLEFCLVFLAADEMLEVTPHHLRLRKTYLTKSDRLVAEREKRINKEKEENA